ncbi:response regulator transcription factor [Mesorhizobium huakuii]|uniref:Response regulator transcription factor n=1 Tax=Mesorhizobium huakuii TaxID=28104 RepID=A0A7G6T4B1_9HYPH|nr:response regulator transcription factor [Mesorhizobium huakuii]QND61593.1 response regulator transcription factor [Mesorhizobium huakuii]QND69211.1 response regulator transcription factor [Mesorhizobium loti]
MTTILVIEDDAQTSREIEAALVDYGYETRTAFTGRDGLVKAISDPYDAIVLDRMLPGNLDGLGVLAALRAAGIHAPVLILSALTAVDERVRGLKAGGDDYLTKPFDFLELTARLDVLLRRRNAPITESVLRAGSLEVDLLTHTVRRQGQLVDLLPREYRLLEYLVRNAGQVVTRTMLFEEIWHYRYDEPTNLIDVHVSKLRRKIDTAGEPSVIQTVRGSGYVLNAAG